MSSEIGVKLTGDNSDFRSMLSDSVEKGGEFAEHVTKHIGDKLFGLRDVSHAVATGLGLNLEKIAEKIAEWYTGMNEEEKKAYEESGKLGDELFAAQKKNADARLSEEQKYRKAVQERQKLQEEIETASAEKIGDQNKLTEKKIELERVVGEIEAQDRKRAAEDMKEFEASVAIRSAAADRAHAAAMAKLDSDEKEKALREEIEAIESALVQGILDEASAKKFALTLTQRQVELEKTTADAQAKHRSTLEEIQKLRYDALPIEEKILIYQNSIETLTRIIASKKKEHVEHDEEDLNLLQNQRDVQALIKEQEAGRLTIEEKITEQIQDQIAGYTSILSRTGNSYQQQSTAALTGVQGRLTSQLSEIGSDGMQIRNATVSGNYADWLKASTIQSELDAVNKELSLRASVVAYDKQYGDAATTAKFGDTVTQRALRDIQTTGQQTADGIQMLSNQLANSGLFPVAGGPVK